MIFEIKQAVCPVCHENMNHKYMSKELVYLKIWLCDRCHYWIPSNPSGDGAFQYRDVKLKNKSEEYEKWKDKCFEIMKEKFWDKYESCPARPIPPTGSAWCVVDVSGLYIHNLQWCDDCGTLYPNEQGLPSTVCIQPSWLKKVK